MSVTDPYSMTLDEIREKLAFDSFSAIASKEAEVHLNGLKLDGVKLWEMPLALLPGNMDWATDEECRDAALDWANTIRGEYNMDPLEELPMGRLSDTTRCVMACALDGLGDRSCELPETERYGLSGGGARFAREGEVIHLVPPPLVNEFMVRFDRGRYPDLAQPLTRLVTVIDASR